MLSIDEKREINKKRFEEKYKNVNPDYLTMLELRIYNYLKEGYSFNEIAKFTGLERKQIAPKVDNILHSSQIAERFFERYQFLHFLSDEEIEKMDKKYPGSKDFINIIKNKKARSTEDIKNKLGISAYTRNRITARLRYIYEHEYKTETKKVAMEEILTDKEISTSDFCHYEDDCFDLYLNKDGSVYEKIGYNKFKKIPHKYNKSVVVYVNNKNNQLKKVTVSRLMGKAFLNITNNDESIEYIDGDFKNVKLSNLKKVLKSEKLLKTRGLEFNTIDKLPKTAKYSKKYNVWCDEFGNIYTEVANNKYSKIHSFPAFGKTYVTINQKLIPAFKIVGEAFDKNPHNFKYFTYIDFSAPESIDNIIFTESKQGGKFISVIKKVGAKNIKPKKNIKHWDEIIDLYMQGFSYAGISKKLSLDVNKTRYIANLVKNTALALL